MFDISQYNDGCSPALTFKTAKQGSGPGLLLAQSL